MKRLHDREKRATYLAGMFLPVYNLLLLFELGFLRGTVGDNEWGPDPTEPPLMPIDHRASFGTRAQLVAQLNQLQRLKDGGGISESEFTNIKAKLLREADAAPVNGMLRQEPSASPPRKSDG